MAMHNGISKSLIVRKLQQDILLWQGFTPPAAEKAQTIGLGPLESAFPNGVFPTGVIHEMLCPTPEDTAATSGLLSGVLQALMRNGGACIWISTCRRLFPPAMARFGVPVERVIFIDACTEKEVLWAAEEALKCTGIAAVVAELSEITFAQSRRLQLAVEDSKVTGFILRNDLKKLSTTTCVARWQVRPIPSVLEDGMPGVGHPRWQVDLLRVRNGSPGSWQLAWSPDGFMPVEEQATAGNNTETAIRQVG